MGAMRGRRCRAWSGTEVSNIADDMVVVESKIKSDRILPRQRLYTSFGSSRVCGVLAGLQTKLRSDFEFARPCTSSSYRDRAVSPCERDTVENCTHECVPTLTRQTTAFPSLWKHSFCPRRHPLRPGRRLFAPNSRVSRQSFQISGPTRCLPRAVNVVDRS